MGGDVQWDTMSTIAEGLGEKLYLIKMIDDATIRLFSRFVRNDSTRNMVVLEHTLSRYGRR